VSNLPTVIAWVPHWCDLLWWPSAPLLLWSERGTTELLWLLLLKLLAVAPKLRRSVQLSRGWCVNHAVLWWSTARTTSGGSWNCPLLLLFLSHLTTLHGALLINGSASKIVVGQVQVLNQVVLQLNNEPLVIELGLLSIAVNMMSTVLCQVVKLLDVLIHRVVPLMQL
jgi:hypothetical protein